MVMVMRQREFLTQLFMTNPSHTIAILAYNNHELTLKNIQHLINNGYKNNILLFDNGSNPTFKNIPKFAIGRWGWDNWLIWNMRRKGIPIIDGTNMIDVIHQNHE